MSAITSTPEIHGGDCHPRSRGEATGAGADGVRKPQEQPRHLQPQPQPQLQPCRHHPRLNSLTSSPSSLPLPSYPTDSTLNRDSSIELVRRPEAAYLSPHRALPSFEFLSTTSSITLNECCAPSRPQTTLTHTAMGLSKTQRIAILLAIDSAFFLVELIVGKWDCDWDWPGIQLSHANFCKKAMLFIHSPSLPIPFTCSMMFCPCVSDYGLSVLPTLAVPKCTHMVGSEPKL
jgi:hypothetical protein